MGGIAAPDFITSFANAGGMERKDQVLDIA